MGQRLIFTGVSVLFMTRRRFITYMKKETLPPHINYTAISILKMRIRRLEMRRQRLRYLARRLKNTAALKPESNRLRTLIMSAQAITLIMSVNFAGGVASYILCSVNIQERSI